MSDKVKQTIYTVIALVVIGLYIAGMIMMICGNAGNGITLWVISTVVGAFLLYMRRTREKIRADAEAEAEEEARRTEGKR